MISKLASIGLAAVALALPMSRLAAQTAADEVAKGNVAYDARNATEALSDYERAIALDPRDYDALWRASRSAVDLAEGDPNEAHRTATYKTAEDRARLATEVNPNGADGHFTLARALGRRALTLGARDRVKYAGSVRDQALACLRIEPKYAGCLHVMGVWNAEVMRLSGFTRMFAKTFLGGQVFSQASWDAAQKYLEDAVANDPRRIVHKLDLGKVYVDRGMKAQARAQFNAVVAGELVDYNDPEYKTEAAAALRKL